MAFQAEFPRSTGLLIGACKAESFCQRQREPRREVPSVVRRVFNESDVAVMAENKGSSIRHIAVENCEGKRRVS